MGIEKRLEKRIPSNELKDVLLNAAVKVSIFDKEMRGKTVNASKNGLCVEFETINFFNFGLKEGQNILVIFEKSNIKLQGSIIYVKEDEKKCQLGIRFSKTDKEKYQELLE